LPKSATDEEIAQIVSISDNLTQEIGGISFEVNSKYDWHILDLISDADQLVYTILDNLAAGESNL